MPCFIDTHGRPALCWVEMEEEDRIREYKGELEERNWEGKMGRGSSLDVK